MDRYFFHVDYGEYTRDLEGTLLPNVEAARAAAVLFLGELLRDKGDRFWAKPNMTITVEDASGLRLFTIDVSGVQSPAAAARR